MAYYGGGYYGGGMLPALQIDPVGLGAANAERITQTEQGQLQLQEESALAPLEIAAKRQELQNEQQLSPLELAARTQGLQTQTAQSKTQMTNSQLAEVARQAAAADPADASMVWDRGMKNLADQGVDLATQYVGHYRPDLAERVSDVYGNEPSARAGRTQANALGPDPTVLVQRLSALPQPVLQQMVQRQNRIIEGFNNVKDEASWKAEIDALQQAGIDVKSVLPSLDWNPLNYAAAAKIVSSLAPMRDAASQVLAASATGSPIVPPAGTGQTFAMAGVDQQGRPIYYDKKNPNITYTGQAPLGAKPSAQMSALDFKRNAWLSVHPGDEQGALDYMQGKRNPSASELENMAMTRANQELGDAVLAGAQIDNPDQWVRNKARENFQLLSGARIAAPGAPQQRPQQRPRLSQADIQASIANAKAAIAKGVPRAAVLQRLQQYGVPTQGL